MSQKNYPKCGAESEEPGCGKPMRPRHASAKAVPNTVAMGHKGLCKTCVAPAPAKTPAPRKTKLPEEVRTAHTVAGLESFYARRYARGVTPEAVPSILYRPARAPLAEVVPLQRPAGRELAAAA